MLQACLRKDLKWKCMENVFRARMIIDIVVDRSSTSFALVLGKPLIYPPRKYVDSVVIHRRVSAIQTVLKVIKF